MAVKRFPGFIDVHCHFREPGATHKEDFRTGTRAALKGGFTFVIDMPNNFEPTISMEALNKKISLVLAENSALISPRARKAVSVKEKALCDMGFHYGTNGFNTDSFKQAYGNPNVFGLKVYLNHTTGELLIEDRALLENVFKSWQSQKPILVHAEGKEKLATAISLAKKHGRRLHLCHIARKEEVVMVKKAKAEGQKITAGVCPHHLFMTKEDAKRMKGFALMKPELGALEDQEALWEGLRQDVIDLVETDHAPHTREEKESKEPPFGVPGLESAVGLLGKAIAEKRITISLFKKLLYDNPKKIFKIPDQPGTYVEIDFDKSYILKGPYETKCGWSPFEGWQLFGLVKKVFFRGRAVVENGKLV